MSKKDYELIAGVLREYDLPPFNLIEAFADALRATNPRFDRARFIAACVGKDSTDSAGRKVRYSIDPLAGQRS